MLSEKLGKKISETLFYSLKKEAIAKREQSGEWLDYYTRFHFVEHYQKRIEEMEHIQKHLLMIFTKEDGKTEKQNKYLMNQLAKTITTNSKVLAEFGMAPPIISKIKSMILLNISTNNNGEILHYDEERTTNIDGNNNPIPAYSRKAKSAIFSPIDNIANSHDECNNRASKMQ